MGNVSETQVAFVAGQQDMADAMRDWLDLQDPDATEARDEVIRYARLVASWKPEVYRRQPQPQEAAEELANLRRAVWKLEQVGRNLPLAQAGQPANLDDLEYLAAEELEERGIDATANPDLVSALAAGMIGEDDEVLVLFLLGKGM